ncbi:MAG TPA: hypothetical protein VHJ83_01280 [Micromonosporaceae bacterium]|jgi:hypothetical protein|nr:hypothetical protein [Micromonosporaceae bacterium]
MKRSVVRRGSTIGGLLLVAGMLAGCGEAEALPDNLCALVGDDLIEGMIPDGVVEPPYRSKRYGLNTIACDAASPEQATERAKLHVLLERHGPCTSLRRGETTCNPRAYNAEDSYENHCESLMINQERYGREVAVTGLGDRACATVTEPDTETGVHVVVHRDGDVVLVAYTTQPSREKAEAVKAAREVAGHVLSGL